MLGFGVLFYTWTPHPLQLLPQFFACLFACFYCPSCFFLFSFLLPQFFFIPLLSKTSWRKCLSFLTSYSLFNSLLIKLLCLLLLPSHQRFHLIKHTGYFSDLTLPYSLVAFNTIYHASLLESLFDFSEVDTFLVVLLPLWGLLYNHLSWLLLLCSTSKFGQLSAQSWPYLHFLIYTFLPGNFIYFPLAFNGSYVQMIFKSLSPVLTSS